MSASSIFRSFSRSPRKFLLTAPGKVMSRIAPRFAGVASRNGFLASLYYTFLSPRFYREHRSVLAGIAHHRGAKISTLTSFGAFRRNVHRIEKALIMQPRRESFAEGYIDETVMQFAKAHGSAIDDWEQKWAGDVLTQYFSEVKDTPVIAEARTKFERIGYVPDGAKPFIPYEKSTVVPSGIDFEQLHALFRQRRSVRWFDERPVPREAIEAAVEAASLAPTACNRLPYRFHAAFTPERVQQIARWGIGTGGFAHNIRCIVVLVGDLSNYVDERDRHLIYIDSSLASMQFMLALEALGLSSVPLNWADVEELELGMQKELGLLDWERPIMLIGVGYGTPEGQIPYSPKKKLTTMLRVED